MSQPRPASLTSVGQAYNNYNAASPPIIDLMGVVVDFLPPHNTSLSDKMITFTIQDPDMIKIPCLTKGLKARFFASHVDDLPRIQSKGDVILIRHCKVTQVKGNPMICNFKGKSGTSTIVFPSSSIPDEAFKQAFLGGKNLDCLSQPPRAQPDTAEQMYAIYLKKVMGSLLGPSLLNPIATASAGPSNAIAAPIGLARNKSGAPAGNKNKFRLIKDVKYNDYCDLIVEVIKKYPNSSGNVELYVTDYTSNDFLFDYAPPNEQEEESEEIGRDGDSFGYVSRPKNRNKNVWPGPFGQRALMVELLPPHAGFAREMVKEGDFVMLQNVRIKQSYVNKMEGNLWQDPRFLDKILVHILRAKNRPEMQDLLERQRKYWDHHKNTIAAKSSRKKQKNKNKKDKKNASATDVDDSTSKPTTTAGNKHVRCSNGDIPLTTLADLSTFNHEYRGKSGHQQTLPFNAHLRRVRVRVIDFWPSTLDDFAQPMSDHPEASEGEEMDIDDSSQKWKWDFFLLLEDVKASQPSSAPAQQWVHVEHGDVEFLFSMEEDATNLRHNSQTLAKLREKMAILWGNLEETKIATRNTNQPAASTENLKLSNVPFECCIQEYGQQIDVDDAESDSGDPKFVQIYGLCKTTIMC